MSIQSPSWSTVKESLEKTAFQIREDALAPAYAPQKRTFAFSLQCFSALTEQLFTDLQLTAIKLKTPNAEIPSHIELAFNLDTTAKRLEDYTIQIMSMVKPTQKEGKDNREECISTKKPSDQAVTMNHGLSPEEQIASIQKVQKVVLQWFENQSETSHGKKYWKASAAKIAEKTAHHDPMLLCFFYKEFRLRRSKNPIAFTKTDRAIFGIEKSQKLPDPTAMNCISFALMKAQELRAKEYIFHGKALPAEHLIPLLKSWGYTPVETPQPNDLVMYLDSQNTPQHLARYLATGQVESKLGQHQPYFHWHDLFDVPGYYGNRIVFWRESPSTYPPKMF